MSNNWLVFSGISGSIGVALGAFGAHGLSRWLPLQKMTIFESGVRYHLIHTLALLGMAILLELFPSLSNKLRWVARLILTGIFLFSGGIYTYTLTDFKMISYLIPVGGLAWIIAWGMLAVIFIRVSPKSDIS